jgi:rSAM/selenodomain-associated transferase 1
MTALKQNGVLVFCKAPIPGQVKTRLIPSLSKFAAADLHCQLTESTFQRLNNINAYTMELWCSPNVNHAFFVSLSDNYNVDRFQQTGNDLGEKMHLAFCDALTRYRFVVIIGCDCPSLTQADIQEAFLKLQTGCHCILGPAEDGGYVLIGLRQPVPTIFDNMPWGTDKVLGLTRQRLNAAPLTCHEIQTQWDIDTPEDLRRYQALIAGGQQ